MEEEESKPVRYSPWTGKPNYEPSPFQEKIDEITLPIVEKVLMNPDLVENCFFRATQATVLGFPMGFAMGLFFSAVSNSDYYHNLRDLSWKKQVVLSGKYMVKYSYNMAKTMSALGGIFVLLECAVEKKRAKHDIYNSLIGGCGAGGLLAIRGGPYGILFGCGGMALFSAVIDLIFLH